MSFAFPPVEAETGIPITGRDASLTDYLGLKFTIGAGQTAGRAITGMIGDLFDDSELLDPKRANELYGNPDTGLVFDEPIRENRARAMQERHDLNAIAQAELDTIQNVGWVKGSAGFVTQMIGGMSHPIDFSMNLIPFVGSAKLAKGATGPLSAAMTRGLLISEETIAKHVTFPRITAAVIDATAGNILAEIPVAIQARRNKEEYGTEDFAVNILGGALIAGGLKGITLGLARAREAHTRLTPEIQDRMLKDAIQQIAVGKSPDVHSHATIDPKLMEAEWKAREGGIIAEAEAIIRKESVGSLTTLSEIAANREARGLPLDEPQTRAALEDPNFAARVSEIKASSAKTIDERLANVPEYVRDEIKRQHDLAKTIGKLDEIVNASVSGRTASDVAAEVLPGYPLSDAKDMVRAVRAAEGIPSQDDIRGALVDSPEYKAFVKERIDKYVAEQKKLFDVEYQKKLAVSNAARAKQEIGPLAKPEDVAKLDGTRVPEAAIADLAEDARALSAEIEADIKALELEDPELAARVQKMVDDELKAIDSPEPKAVDAAMRCLINE